MAGIVSGNADGKFVVELVGDTSDLPPTRIAHAILHNYAIGSSSLTALHKQILATVGKFMQENSARHVYIKGEASASWRHGPDRNLELSEARSRLVQAFLIVEQSVLPPTRTHSIGVGAPPRVIPGTTQVDKSENPLLRRVIINIFSKFAPIPVAVQKQVRLAA